MDEDIKRCSNCGIISLKRNYIKIPKQAMDFIHNVNYVEKKL